MRIFQRSHRLLWARGRQIGNSSVKICVIVNAPKPENMQHLRAFLGFVTYYHHLEPNLSTVVVPLNERLHYNVVLNWSLSQELVFQEAKDILTSDIVLYH